MKRKIVGILACMMLMMTIPVSAGLNYDTDTTETTERTEVICDDEPEPEPEGLFDRTIIRGIILFPRTSFGGDFRFLALRIHYTTFYLGGIKKGTVMLRSIALDDIPTGYIGNYYITGMFKGNLDAYT